MSVNAKAGALVKREWLPCKAGALMSVNAKAGALMSVIAQAGFWIEICGVSLQSNWASAGF